MAGRLKSLGDSSVRRLKLRDLRYLSAIADSGSISQAAKILGTSQPAISKALTELEHAVGVRLLDRTPQGAEPTIYGRVLIARVHASIDELRQGINEIESLANPGTGEVRIGCTEAIAAGFLPAVISRFVRKYPRVRLIVEQSNSATLDYRDLRERKLDVLIARAEQSMSDDVLHAEVLLRSNHIVVAGAQSKWARRRKIKLADLLDASWIRPLARSPLNEVHREAFAACGLDPPSGLAETFSIHVIFHLIAREGFVAILPGYVQEACREWSIKVLPVELPIERWPLAMVTIKNRTLSAAALRFIDYTRDTARSMARRPGR